MSAISTFDLKSNCLLEQSLVPETLLASEVAANGAGVDCAGLVGFPHGLFSLGAATGTPTSFAVTCKLQESADNSNWTDIEDQTSLVLTADSSAGYVRGVRSMRYVRAVATAVIVDGTSPKVPATAQIQGQLQIVS